MRLPIVLLLAPLVACAPPLDAPAGSILPDDDGGKADDAREGRPLVVGTLAYGETSSTCAASTRTRAYAFSGAGGDPVRIWVRGEGAEVWLADGGFRGVDARAARDGDGAPVLAAQLPASGTFHVVFRGDGEVSVSLGGPHGATCLRPLHQHCGDEGCRTYDEALAEARAAWPCYQAHAGTCGPFRYVSYSNGFIGWNELFDETGAMVAAERIDDTRMLCGGTAMRELFALDVGCEREPAEIICGRQP